MARKNEILDALISIFRTKGIGSDFTMSELATKVNIGKSTIYEYFKTKDEVLQQAICRVIEQSIEEVHNRELNDSSFEQMYKEDLRYLFNIALNSRFLFNLVTTDFKNALPDNMRGDIMVRMKGVSQYYEDRFQQIFIKGVEEGIIKVDNIAINSLLISSLVAGSIMRLANANVDKAMEVDIEEYIDALYSATIKIMV